MTSSPPPIRRYLTNFDSTRTGNVLTDCLVIGAGVAGLSAAQEAGKSCDVIVITKASVKDSATYWAQGGVASVRTSEDSVEQHIRDTMTVGAGLNRREAVDLICREGCRRISELIERGMPFDRHADELELGLEAGHSVARILHAGGDATGRAISDFLSAGVRDLPNVRVFENCFLIDLLSVDGQCAGAVTFHPKHGHQLIWARRTILSSGGLGQLYRETTNPPGITGDGVAAAFRAGADVCDTEFMQFHPTTLYIAGSTRALISEAVRGEGAYLVDKTGARFMNDYHPDGELAPRDVVSQAIVSHLAKVRAPNVYLDVRHIGRERFVERFPTITQRCQEFGIDPGKDLIPVRPAAHFAIGGVVTDLRARTSLEGLFCCGEAACCGLHGANRLASNSLLEGMVMGGIAGSEAAADAARDNQVTNPRRVRNQTAQSSKTMLDLDDIRHSLQSLIWRNAGIVRDGDRLAETIEIIDFWSKFVFDKTFDEARGWEVQNMLLLGRLLAAAAYQRRESRGVHFRSDFNQRRDDDVSHHIVTKVRDGEILQRRVDLSFSPLSDPAGLA